MNQDQVTSIVRQVLLAVGGAAVTKGWIDSGTMTAVAGALAIIIASAWALYTRREAGLVASAAAQPSVKAVVMTDKAAADAVPASNVVGPNAKP